MRHASEFLLVGLGSICLAAVPLSVFANDINFFPLTPRLSGLAMGGTDEIVSGEAMAALLGNENGIWLLDLQSKTAFHSSWVGSVGTGLRFVQGDQRILGAYVFGDRNVSETNNEYWFISPGIESMGELFDFRMNGYIPAGTQRNLASTGFADTFGNYNYVTFTGHDQLDAIVNNYEEVGWGLDGEAGIRLARLKGVRLYAGGYHFNLQNADDINGFAGRIQIPINSYIEFNVRDSYDNEQHNTIEVGLRFTLGGVNKAPLDPSQPIRQRLLDPIERNLATLGQGTAEPVVDEQEVVNPENPLVLERDNIWFFSPSASDVFTDASSCTAENPCVNTNFTQSTIDSINAGPTSPDVIVNPTPSDNPSFYLAPGNYSTLTISGMTATPFTFTDDMVYGRSADFTQPQQAAFLNGAIILNGTDTFDSVIFHNDPSFTQAIGLTLNTGSNLILTNSIVGTDENTQGYATAIEMHDANLNATASEIHAYSSTQNVTAVGIDTQDTAGSTINLTDSLVKATANITTAPSQADFLAAVGINLGDVSGSTVNLRNTEMNVVAQSSLPLSGNVSALGINIGTDNTSGTENINLSNGSAINVNGDFAGGTPTVIGVGSNLVGPPNAQTINVSLTDSDINVGLTGSYNSVTDVEGIALNAALSNLVVLTNSTVKASSDASAIGGAGRNSVTGINEVGASTETVNLNNSQVIATESGANANDFSNGIVASGGNDPSTVDISLTNGSEVTATASNSTASGLVQSFGIAATADTAQVSLDDSSVTAQVTSSGNASQNLAVGISDFTSTSDTVNLNNNSQVNVTVNAGLPSYIEAHGISQAQFGNATSNIMVNNSLINVDVTGVTTSSFSGILLVDDIDGSDTNQNINLTQAKLIAGLSLNTVTVGGQSVRVANINSNASGAFSLTANQANMQSSFDLINSEAFAPWLVANVVSSSSGAMNVDIQNSQLNASGSIDTGIATATVSLQVVNLDLAYSSSANVNLQNSTLDAKGILLVSSGGNNILNTENLYVGGSGSLNMTIQDSTLSGSSNINFVNTFSNDILAVDNILIFPGSAPNTVTVTNSTLNRTAGITTNLGATSANLFLTGINSSTSTITTTGVTFNNSVTPSGGVVVVNQDIYP